MLYIYIYICIHVFQNFKWVYKPYYASTSSLFELFSMCRKTAPVNDT